MALNFGPKINPLEMFSKYNKKEALKSGLK